jgi:hypothetical protein
MSAQENGTRNSTQQQSPSPLMNDEEKTAQYGLAQDCLNY